VKLNEPLLVYVCDGGGFFFLRKRVVMKKILFFLVAIFLLSVSVYAGINDALFVYYP
jgi:hypothetical protein